MISDKVRPHHLQRKAILYVRQSSAHQVLQNRESSALQYAMRDRLMALGWSEIEVIDDDLGRSAAGGVQRAGFERMVAEVCLGKVGAVCARELHRADPRFAVTLVEANPVFTACPLSNALIAGLRDIAAQRFGYDAIRAQGVAFVQDQAVAVDARARRVSLRAAYPTQKRPTLLIQPTSITLIVGAALRSCWCSSAIFFRAMPLTLAGLA